MKPKIVIACDSFKGSLGSREVGIAAAKGVRRVLKDADIRVVVIADGGEGTVEAVTAGCGGAKVVCEVTAPLRNRATAFYGRCGDMAIVEMAQASGLTLVPANRRNPSLTTSFGTGELIKHALDNGCRRFLVGIGGSATNDGGAGMLQALGFRLLDSEKKDIGAGGAELLRLDSIEATNVVPALRNATFTVACDVTNPLTGTNGASRVFGPQKGADPEMIGLLDRALRNFAQKTVDFCGYDMSAEPGTGAAGGMGFAFRAFLGATLRRGVEMVLDAVGFDEMIRDAALVITGEGCLDSQTCMGKAPWGVLQRCVSQGVPLVAIGGSVKQDSLQELLSAGFTDVLAVTPAGMSLGEAMIPAVAAANVERTVLEFVSGFNFRDCRG